MFEYMQSAISTHSAREDGDLVISPISFVMKTFQPTPPARTETSYSSICSKFRAISTHSAREDGDMEYGTVWNG